MSTSLEMDGGGIQGEGYRERDTGGGIQGEGYRGRDTVSLIVAAIQWELLAGERTDADVPISFPRIIIYLHFSITSCHMPARTLG